MNCRRAELANLARALDALELAAKDALEVLVAIGVPELEAREVLDELLATLREVDTRTPRASAFRERVHALAARLADPPAGRRVLAHALLHPLRGLRTSMRAMKRRTGLSSDELRAAIADSGGAETSARSSLGAECRASWASSSAFTSRSRRRPRARAS